MYVFSLKLANIYCHVDIGESFSIICASSKKIATRIWFWSFDRPVYSLDRACDSLGDVGYASRAHNVANHCHKMTIDPPSHLSNPAD